MIGSLERLHRAALADYRAAFRKPSVRAARIKDYRAGYGSDTENDAADRAAGRKLKCPVLVPRDWPRQLTITAIRIPPITANIYNHSSKQ